MKLKIGPKILLLLLITSLVSLVAMTVIGLSGMSSIRNTAAENNVVFSTQTTADSTAALQNLAQSQLAALVREKAKLSDSELRALGNYVSILSDEMTRIASDPENHPPRAVSPPLRGNTDITPQLLYTTEASARAGDPSLQAQAGLLAHLQDTLVAIHKNNEMIGATYAATPDGVSIVADVNSNGRVLDDGSIKPYESTQRPWYLGAVSSGDLYFSDITPDSLGNGPGIMIGKPYYDKSGNIAGAVGLGAFLSQIDEIVTQTTVGKTGYAFILGHDGSVLLTPQTGGELARDWENPVDLRLSEDHSLSDAATKMVDGQSGVCEVGIDGKQMYLAYAPLTYVDASFGIVIEVDEVLEPAMRSAAYIKTLSERSAQTINDSVLLVTILFVVAALTLLVVAVLCLLGLSRRITRPIRQLTEKVAVIANGDLDVVIDLHSGDEVQTLGESVTQMTVDLKNYINNLAATTAEKERMGAELNVAKKIQASVLPRTFPPFPEHPEFDLYASMDTAKEVGGDFYDFFFVDDQHVAAVIADVSGKGVPAALFMMVARTLIKNATFSGMAPHQVFELVNNMLCEGNDTCMFVTVFMGILDLETGEFVYSNAGHNFPIMLRAGGDADWLKTKIAFMLAAMEDTKYTSATLQFAPGDTLLLYTDGVTEAFNDKDQLFSDQRLLDLMQQLTPEQRDPHQLLGYLKEQVDEFARGVEQADDITMLALRWEK